MEINAVDTLQIFTNPDDLTISIQQYSRSGKFYVCICRGPREGFKPIVTSEPFADDTAVAIQKAGEILEMVRSNGIDHLKRSPEAAPKCFKPGGQDIDESKVLNTNLIKEIIKRLQQCQRAYTHQFRWPLV